MFEHVAPYAGDPIFRIAAQYQADQRENKVNLTIGLYFEDDGSVPLLACTQTAEQRWASQKQPRIYTPMEGLASYRNAVQRLVFGAEHEAYQSQRIATIQTLGGTGALKVGGDLLHEAYPDSQMWISDPAWDNHHAIFGGCGIKTNKYRYFDATTQAVDFEGMMDDLSQLPAHSFVLLHPCCHNPTGADLSPAQWQALITLIKSHQLIPFLDMAYQGFGQGLDEDAYAVRAMAEAGVHFLVANSFSKNFSYYAERCGALSIVCADKTEAELTIGKLNAWVRKNYSNPPIHGAAAIALVLTDPELFQSWVNDVDAMRARIHAMRHAVHQHLARLAPQYDADYMIKQQGMFSYTGLSLEQILRLREEFGVYMLDSGRISVPGLTTKNVAYYAQSLAAVVNPD
ncbi:aromatic amino acid transaminase [Paenalcaligenes hominis]|uniref:Aromatic-amino-acid transaminase n=1 Tax=Paenalcaligenes hominis TaxID=643674 RepID=A0ABX0WRS8_9BURK|nr:amino acid aminotransferase [Paenalcaligenes hominis]NJB65467.1 aromatic-amino-acid transaminase [Paenalcaligenes hominis]GGE65661.1 aromatic amino acid aminotransferase [Paenalcaligenes hominis]